MQEKNIHNENVIDHLEDGEKPKYAKALYSFEARTEEELSIVAGEYLVVSDMSDNNGWWEVRCCSPPVYLSNVSNRDNSEESLDISLRTMWK